MPSTFRRAPREVTSKPGAIPGPGDTVRFADAATGAMIEGVVVSKAPSKFQRAPRTGDREGVHGFRLGVNVGEPKLRFVNAEAAVVMVETDSLRRTGKAQRRSRP
jgi:hypothetical protein